MAIRGRDVGAAAAAVLAVLAASGGCFKMVRGPGAIPTHGIHVGSDIGSPGVGADLVYKRAPTHPNLTLFAASPGRERISGAPCSPSAGRDSISAADRICARMAIQNSGYGGTDGATEILILLDGSPLETWVVPGTIDSGDVVERRDLPFGPLAPGTHVLRIVIDPDNTVAETNESDNDATVPFLVSPRPGGQGAPDR